MDEDTKPLPLTKLAVKELAKVSARARQVPDSHYKTTHPWYHSLYDQTLAYIERPAQLKNLMDDLDELPVENPPEDVGTPDEAKQEEEAPPEVVKEDTVEEMINTKTCEKPLF